MHENRTPTETNNNKIKLELDEGTNTESEGLKRCNNSSLLQSPLSPPNLNRISDDETKSPAGTLKRNSVKSSVALCKKESPNSSPIPDSPQNGGQPKSRKRKSISDNGLHPLTTPVTESQVFTFGSKVIRMPSPPTPHFSPTVKSSTSLMNTKDLVPISDDLDHLFDDDEDENSAFKKVCLFCCCLFCCLFCCCLFCLLLLVFLDV